MMETIKISCNVIFMKVETRGPPTGEHCGLVRCNAIISCICLYMVYLTMLSVSQRLYSTEF